jgi:hypothetical protein
MEINQKPKRKTLAVKTKLVKLAETKS